MPFSTDATWPKDLLTIFDIYRHHDDSDELPENRYYGPYNKLLNYCFSDFIAPHQHFGDLTLSDTVDVIVFLIVFDANCRPVLFAEVKDDAWNTRPDFRLSADEQMRQRYDTMLSKCLIPRLWGLSLLGTSLRVYCGGVATNSIEPGFEDSQSPDHNQPRFDKMKEIVGDILAHST
ncbi:hypothetical protein Clacol_001179 [Clathrus columnatus]|uniref:NERD domain-containing protein n=1 Tax=Clathrus columnatus TaxID=1419009 RepID=A0AAV5A346_9AGAM|nr:hypothetical protein Clacol_001179 [Clathrus columnatus]